MEGLLKQCPRFPDRRCTEPEAAAQRLTPPQQSTRALRSFQHLGPLKRGVSILIEVAREELKGPRRNRLQVPLRLPAWRRRAPTTWPDRNQAGADRTATSNRRAFPIKQFQSAPGRPSGQQVASAFRRCSKKLTRLLSGETRSCRVSHPGLNPRALLAASPATNHAGSLRPTPGRE